MPTSTTATKICQCNLTLSHNYFHFYQKKGLDFPGYIILFIRKQQKDCLQTKTKETTIKMDTINYAIESDDEGNFVIEESHSENGYLVDEWTNITGDLTDGGYGPPQLSWDKLVDVLWDLQMEGGWITADQLTELLENRDLSVDADNYLYQ